MRRVLVIGVGNRIMRDDSIGVRVADALAEKTQPDNLRFLAGETDVEYCLAQLPWADECIIIDGSFLGAEPCTVTAFSLEEIFGQSRTVHSFHDFDLIHGMKREGLEKKGLLISIEVAEIGFSTALSDLLEKGFGKIVGRVWEIIEEYIR